MPTIIISGHAEAYQGDPRGKQSITSRKTLALLHGLVSARGCAEAFDETPLSKIGLTGGRLRFELDPESRKLRITTMYHTPRRLTDKETAELVEATRTQWSDGCGSGSFDGWYGSVYSTALAMALLNSGESEDDIGEYFVDAFPMDSDEEPQVEFFADDVEEKSDIDYLQEAADLGNAEAQYRLGRSFEDGEGVEKDETAAFEFYAKAADQGHLSGITFLGLCYQRGTGTEQDERKAVKLFQKAADEGLPLAMHCLGECYVEGKGVKTDVVEGVSWYRRGAKTGDVGCMAELGDCYELGRGVDEDLERALELYERCMEAGFDPVEPAIKRVKKKLRGRE
jgi:hypothetical protein